MFLLREVHAGDLDALETLASHLNTLNLPAHRPSLEALVHKSHQSFGGELPHPEREYLFGLIVDGALVGTCMIIAQHGTFERPAVYFNVSKEQKYSRTLKKYFVHQVLQLSFTFDGATEIGGLILDPSLRGHPQKLGKLLSFVRFLFIGMYRDRFRDEIVAELLPELNPDGTSDLWECLGHNFTELPYEEADKLSRENVEFIRNLFPQTPIYTALLPAHVREKIGVVGAPSKPVESMLRSIGFEWDHSIDPFDGGPSFVCRTDRCRMVTRTHRSPFSGPFGPEDHPEGYALVATARPTKAARFRATLCTYRRSPTGYVIDPEAVALLGLTADEEIGILPLSGQDIEDFYGLPLPTSLEHS